MVVELVDVSHVSPQLFITGAVLIMLIGSFLSLGVLRLFQQRKRQGIVYLALSALSLIILLVSVNTWLA
jgi:fucose permease